MRDDVPRIKYRSIDYIFCRELNQELRCKRGDKKEKKRFHPSFSQRKLDARLAVEKILGRLVSYEDESSSKREDLPDRIPLRLAFPWTRATLFVYGEIVGQLSDWINQRTT